MKLASWSTLSRPPSRSARPFSTAISSPARSPDNRTARALIVKSLRARSSSSLPGPDLGQGAGLRIGLRAPVGDVDPAGRPHHGRGSEAVVEGEHGGALTAELEHPQQLAGETCGLAGDDHVELRGRSSQQQVADGAPDEGHVVMTLGQLPQLAPPRLLGEAPEDHLWCAHTGTRTGTPASARGRLGLRDREAAVVEDRGAQDGVGAGLRRPPRDAPGARPRRRRSPGCRRPR